VRPNLSRSLRLARHAARNLRAGEAIYPFYASFKVTHRCDRACAFCDVAQTRSVREVSAAEVRRMVEVLVASSPLILCFEGGEPFLREDFEEILEHAARQPMLLSAVTSFPSGLEERVVRLSRYLDYLQISVDRWHGNLDLLNRLQEIRRDCACRVGVQAVVADEDLDDLEAIVRRVRDGGAKVVLMPAVDLDGVAPLAPRRRRFVETVRELKARHPRTVTTSHAFLRAYGSGAGCSTASVVIDPDGTLYYPCRVRHERAMHLLDGDLDAFLRSARASALRACAANCPRSCGWYQYFAFSMRRLRDLPWDLLAGLERAF
jgi:MoaA/NifB/PqqE/SkfB family radical SAM enzyme